MLGEEFGHLGLDRLGQQGARSVAQHLGKRVGERPWLKQLDDVSIGHGVSLLGWRSGGANTPTIRRLHPVSPSPTFAHSSVPGSGKTSVALALAVAFSALGSVTYFLTAEEAPEDLNARLATLTPAYLSQLSTFSVRQDEWFHADKITF